MVGFITSERWIAKRKIRRRTKGEIEQEEELGKAQKDINLIRFPLIDLIGSSDGVQMSYATPPRPRVRKGDVSLTKVQGGQVFMKL